jgi:hypothetical protein
MRITISIFIVFFIRLSGFAQPVEFFRMYDFGTLSTPVLMNVYENNHKIYINGSINNSNQKIIVLKSDYWGTISDTLIIGLDTGTYYMGNFIETNGNKLYMLCDYDSPLNASKEYVVLIDSMVNFISDSIYQKDNTCFWGNIKINNRYYFTGFTRYDSLGSLLSNYNMYFCKTDTNINIIKENSIGSVNYYDGSNTIALGFDNNLLLGGISLANGNQQDWYLVNVDTNGAVLGEYYYGHPTLPDYNGIKSISVSSDSAYFIAGVCNMGFNTSPYYYDLGAQVVKLDRQFYITLSKYFGQPLPGTSVSKLLKTVDGNQALLSQRTPYQSTTIKYSQVSKFNNNGDILWSRNYYQGDTTDYIRYRAWDMIETSDKGFALCGSAIDTTNVGPYQQAWLVKTDSLGCDGLRSCSDTAMVVQILNYPDTLCKDSTYQIALLLKGRSAPYSLYANSTLVLDSIYYPYTLPLWIDTLMPFVPQDTGWQNLVVTLHEPWERTASDTVQVYVSNCPTTSNLTEFYKRKVEIFPNPASTELHVKIRGVIEGAYTITMYDTQGKTVDIITTMEQETVIDISTYRQGVYWVRVLGNNIVRSEKVIILKK